MATTTAVGVAVTGAPAFAEPNLTISLRPNSVELTVGGGAKTVTITVKNNAPIPASGTVTLSVPLRGQGVRLSSAPRECQANESQMRCDFQRLGVGASLNLQVKISPPRESDIEPGDERQGEGRAAVDGRGISGSEARWQVLLAARGIVPEVSGRVLTTDNKPVPNALIEIKDSAGHKHTTAASSSGSFRFQASADKPLEPGRLQIVASKEGFQPQTKYVTGRAGQPVRDVKFSLLSTSATPSETPSEEEEEEPAPEDVQPTPPAAASTTPAAQDSGLGLFGWFLIIMGVLLVGGGVAAIVLLLRRRDGDDDDIDGDDPYPNRGPVPAASGTPGVYRSSGLDSSPSGGHPTAVLGAADDAPTALHERPFVDHVANTSAASQASRSRGYDDDATQLHPSVSDDPAGATRVYPGQQGGRYGHDDGYGRDGYGRGDHGGRYGHDDGYGRGDHGGRYGHDDGYGRDGYGRDGYGQADHGGDRYGSDGYGRDGYGYGRDGYGADSRDGYGSGRHGDDGYGAAPSGGRYGASDAGYSDRDYRSDDGYGRHGGHHGQDGGGRRRSVQWGDD